MEEYDLDALLALATDGDDDEPEDKKGKKGKKLKGVDGWWADWSKHVSKASEPEPYKSVVQTGIPTFDVAMGVGGLPRGGITTLWGAEGSGKSALWQAIAAAAQEQYPNMIILIIDSESGFNPEIAVRNGMKFNVELMKDKKLIYVNPSLESSLSLEKVAVMIEQLLPVAPDGVLVIMDSMDAMMTAVELGQQADDGGQKFGGKAKLNSFIMPRIAGLLKGTNSSMIVIQQARDKLNSQYAGQIDTAGGRSIKNMSMVRIKMQRANAIKRGDEIVGHQVVCTLDKNKYYKPHVKFTIDLRYDDDAADGGFDKIGSWLDMGKDVEVISVDKAKHTFHTLVDANGEVKVLNGREVVRRWLAAHPEEFAKLKADVMSKIEESANGQ